MDDKQQIKAENTKIIRGLILLGKQPKTSTRDMNEINKSIKELKRRGIILINDVTIKEAILL